MKRTGVILPVVTAKEIKDADTVILHRGDGVKTQSCSFLVMFAQCRDVRTMS